MAKAFLDVAKEFGPYIALSVVVVFFFMFICLYLLRKLIKQKDEEIKRLAAQRNKLEDLILKRRVSSEEPE